ncbi:hypothetical protein BSZ39_09700 [Bowdeniella nasicola]|uniref:HTH gntR-type domain-containing protein n=1 Tax=Bowdeniella nasicola TaxID=208480 RepID=A0A1Q5Q104_9ACTO|nr:GntR family transcriptional regulator [Bowdeniella nasicola]OKL53415.1 hypothetical protein BSZ39_09700 [Bowdeniella nasicola]
MPQSKADRVYFHVRHQILSGEYHAGDRLVLDRIARDCDVSAVPVREAIRRLEAEGLAIYTRNVCAQVAPLDLEHFVETVQALAIIEGIATALSAEHLTAAQLAEARDINEELRLCVRGSIDRERYFELNRAFHFALAQACPNGYLWSSFVELWERAEIIRGSTSALTDFRLFRVECGLMRPGRQR